MRFCSAINFRPRLSLLKQVGKFGSRINFAEKLVILEINSIRFVNAAATNRTKRNLVCIS